jgi:FlaA1/EpsC-like NDP-sugar epimerase
VQGGDDEYSKVGLTPRGEMLKGKWALITGASRGVGWTIAEKFASEQANLILVARSKNDLEKVLPLYSNHFWSQTLLWRTVALTALLCTGLKTCTCAVLARQ